MEGCVICQRFKLADKYNLIVIEDAAQAFGAMCDFNCENSEICKPCNKGTKKAGTYGDAGCFLFIKQRIFQHLKVE